MNASSSGSSSSTATWPGGGGGGGGGSSQVSDFVVDDKGDAAAAVCAYLLAQCHVSGAAMARALGVHPLVIESCLRHNASSPQLRRRLCAWLSLDAANACTRRHHHTHSDNTDNDNDDSGERDYAVAAAVAASCNAVARLLPRSLLCVLLHAQQQAHDHDDGRVDDGGADQTATMTTTDALHEGVASCSHALLERHDSDGGAAATASPHADAVGVTSLSDALDTRGRRHYRALQTAAGQFAMSVLNSTHLDMHYRATTSSSSLSSSSAAAAAAGTHASSSLSTGAWAASWLGSKLFDAFDYSNTGTVGRRVRPLLEVWSEAQHAYTLARGAEASTALLARHPLAAAAAALSPSSSPSSPHDFAEYVRVLSTSYYTNRKEGQRHDVNNNNNNKNTSNSDKSSNNSSDKSATREQPWPHNVPAAYFSTSFASASALDALPSHAFEAVTTTTTATTTTRTTAHDTTASPSTSAAAAAAATTTSSSSSSPSLIEVADYDAIEARVLQLRAWADDVEQCLCVHVQRRSGELAAATRRYDALGTQARAALHDMRAYRTHDVATRLRRVDDVLTLAALYRRRRNMAALVALVSRVCATAHALRTIENWVALPEREAAELLVYTRQLLQLQSLMQDGRTRNDDDNINDDDDAHRAAVTWGVVSQLQCMAGMEQRVAVLRDGMRRIACNELVALLSSSSSSSSSSSPFAAVTAAATATEMDAAPHDGAAVAVAHAQTRAKSTCEAALALDVLPRAVHVHTRATLQAMWVDVREQLTSALIDSSTLTAADADRLLALTTSTTAHTSDTNNTAPTSPTLDDRRALLSFVGKCRYTLFLGIYTRLLDVLLTAVTRAAQHWASFALHVLPADAAVRATATVQLLAPLCTEAELLLALAIESRGGGGSATAHDNNNNSNSNNNSSEATSGVRRSAPPSPREVVRLSRLAWTALPPLHAILHKVEGLLHLHGVLLPPSSSSSSVSLHERGHDTATTRMPCLGLALCRAVQRLARAAFRARCASRLEEMRVVLESEAWVVVDAVSVPQQATVERLCACDAATRRRYAARSLEDVACLRKQHNGNNNNSHSGSRRHTRQRSSSSSSSSHSGHDDSGSDDAFSSDGSDGDADALLHSSRATRLYVSLDDANGDEEGCVVANSLLFLLAVLREHDDALAHFPSLAFDVVTRMAEVVELYDARTAALVLGASAIEQGTLRTITTTHLCVASQCFGFLAKLLPRMQARLLCLLCGDTTATTHDRDDDDATTTTRTSTRAGTAATGAGDGPHGSTTTTAAAASRLRPLIEQSLTRVTHNCCTHHDACLHKISVLVQNKVDSLGHMRSSVAAAAATMTTATTIGSDASAATTASAAGGSARPVQWSQEGNEWVMTMLREVARLLRVVRPLLPPRDVHAVVVPLLGALALRIRGVTCALPASATDARVAAAADVLLFKANVDRFGYDVLHCAAAAAAAANTTTSRDAATAAHAALTPQSSDAEVLQWFLPQATHEQQAASSSHVVHEAGGSSGGGSSASAATLSST